MFINEYILTVDIKKKTQAIVPKFVQHDNATLVFKIFDGGKMYDLSPFTKAEVAHKRPDGQVVVGTANIETLINGERVVRYNYLGSEMHNVGFVETSLSIFSTDKKVTTQPFKVEITTDNRDGLVESSKVEVGLLQNLIAEVSTVLVDAKNAINDANSAVTIANQATTDANTAITNANLAVTEAQDAANATIQVKDDTLIAKGEAEQATINANNAVSNLVHKGEYIPATSYVARNIVSFDGSSYMNIIPSTGISPTDNTHWKLIGKKGDTGLQGIQGIPGEKGLTGEAGKGFSIAKTYTSVAQMYADYSNPLIEIGSFVLINTTDINNVENAMLFVKTNIEYSYLTDLSGAQGIKGEKGLDGISFNWKNNYNNTTTYLKNDVVSYNESSYIALQVTTGNLPTNATYWGIMAQRGVDGTGAVSTVNTKLPNVNGDVTLTPSDIGASPSSHTHSELHTHTNKTVIDGLTDDAGQLKYNGTTVGSVTSVNNQVGDIAGLETVTDSNNKLATKVDKVAGKGLSTEDFTSTEKTKLNGIATNANNYSHPATHPPSIIAQDASNRFMTDTEKTKLSGIATNANNYTHPANHSPSIITQDANNRFMTDAEKTKLSGIESGAQVNAITSVNGATGAITGLATDTSVTNKIGILTELNTTNKTDIVKSINEVTTQLAESANDIISRAVNIKTPFGTNLTPAKGNGIDDDKQIILDALKSEYTSIYVPAGTYFVTPPLTLDSTIHDKTIIFDKNAKIVFAKQSAHGLQLSGCYNLDFVNLNLEHPGTGDFNNLRFDSGAHHINFFGHTKVYDSPTWAVNLRGACHDIYFQYIEVDNTIRGFARTGGDGIDLHSCYNITIDTAIIKSGDDGLCIKSVGDSGVKTHNINIGMVWAKAHGGAISFGSEIRQDCYNINVGQVVSFESLYAVYIRNDSSGTGTLSNVNIGNVTHYDRVGSTSYVIRAYSVDDINRFKGIHIVSVVADASTEWDFINLKNIKGLVIDYVSMIKDDFSGTRLFGTTTRNRFGIYFDGTKDCIIKSGYINCVEQAFYFYGAQDNTVKDMKVKTSSTTTVALAGNNLTLMPSTGNTIDSVDFRECAGTIISTHAPAGYTYSNLTNNTLTNLKGIKSEGVVSGTILNGTSSIDIPHGLPAKPNRAFSFTNTGDNTWVGYMDNTVVRIYRSGTAGDRATSVYVSL